MKSAQHSKPGARRLAWLLLIAVILICVAVVAAPVWLIQPFRPQTQNGLEWSFALRRWSVYITPIGLMVVIVISLWLWRETAKWWPRFVLIVALLPVLISVWFSRQNHFEWMFNPLPNATYARIADAGFASDSDIVMAVRNNGEAVAYPIRQMAYHHLVHDVVGGTPIVATY